MKASEAGCIAPPLVLQAAGAPDASPWTTGAPLADRSCQANPEEHLPSSPFLMGVEGCMRMLLGASVLPM